MKEKTKKQITQLKLNLIKNIKAITIFLNKNLF